VRVNYIAVVTLCTTGRDCFLHRRSFLFVLSTHVWQLACRAQFLVRYIAQLLPQVFSVFILSGRGKGRPHAAYVFNYAPTPYTRNWCKASCQQYSLC
jgi:hypothetical protein